jgi:DNA end-binding protein Ku
VDTSTLHFPAKSEIRKPELDMARSLVESLAAGWDPSKYTDQYRENLMKIIKGKAKGKRVALEADEEKRPAAVIDLMERLRQSLAHTKANAPSTKGQGPRTKDHRHSRRRSVA